MEVGNNLDFTNSRRILNLPNAIAPGHPVTYQQFSPLQMAYLTTDCGVPLGGALSPYAGAAVAGGTLAAGNAAILDPDHPGVVKLRNGTTANGGYRIYTEGIRIRTGAKFVGLVNFNTLVGTTMRIGFHDCATVADAVDGAYFEFSGGVLVAKIANNSVRTSAPNAPVVLATGATDWYRFGVEALSTGARFEVYDKDQVLLYTDTVTAALPTAVGRDKGSGVIATNSGTVASDLIHVDLLHTEFSVLR